MGQQGSKGTFSGAITGVYRPVALGRVVDRLPVHRQRKPGDGSLVPPRTRAIGCTQHHSAGKAGANSSSTAGSSPSIWSAGQVAVATYRLPSRMSSTS